MYSTEDLIEIYNTYEKIIFKSKLYYYLVDNTQYLTGKVFPKQRLWHIIHNTQEIPHCKTCRRNVRWDDAKGFASQQYREFCSSICGRHHSDTKSKKAVTELERYGIGRPEIVAKIKQTNNRKYGTDFAIQVLDFKQKQTETNRKKYGVDNVIQCSAIKDRRKQTNLEKFGYETPAQSMDIKAKTAETTIKKYGSIEQRYQESQLHNTERCLDVYGVPHGSQAHLPPDVWNNLNDKDWLLNQHHTLKQTASAIAKLLGVAQSCVSTHLHSNNVEIKHHYGYSYKSIIWLESIMLESKTFIQHALNGGEYRIPGTRWKVDGYCTETNTIYEFYGDYWHGNPNVYPTEVCGSHSLKTMGELHQKTIERENKIKSLGYNLVVIWEDDWNNDHS